MYYSLSDIQNVMIYFNINQVETERFYKENIHTKKKRYYGNDTYKREERSMNEKRYALIYSTNYKHYEKYFTAIIINLL